MADELNKDLVKARELWNEKNYKEALSIALNSASNGHLESQIFVGWIYLKGEKNIEQDFNEAVKWLDMSAKSGSSVGHYLSGIANYRLLNYPEALNEFIAASKMNYYEADYQIGKMYYFGVGVQKNIETSYQHFLVAKKHGHIFASRQVAVILMKGHKGFVNIIKGFVLFLATIVNGTVLAIKDPYSEKILD